MRKIGLFSLLLALTAGVLVWLWPQGVNSTEAALAVFKVEQMTCGSCVSNIQTALKELDGTGSVEVSVTSGSSKVEFLPGQVTPEEIAARITSAGYPATIKETLSVADYQDLLNRQSRLGNKYIAKIGNRYLSRLDFEQEVFSRAEAQGVSADDLPRLRAQMWDEVLQRELLLGAAELNNVVVSEDEVSKRIESLKGEHDKFEQFVEKQFGSIEQFRQQLKTDMIIQRNIELNVATSGSGVAQQQALQQWYQSLVDNTEIVVFDPEIKMATQSASSGCGGSCCG